jgi:Bax protein
LLPKPWPWAIAPEPQNVATAGRVPQEMPDFAAIEDIEAKKQAFFDYLQPIVDAQNQRITRQRARLLKIIDKVALRLPLSSEDQVFLYGLSRIYDISLGLPDNTSALEQLLHRVDVIPASLVLAQAANESGWGTSRFAREGYNLFGQWCYREGCGLIPKRRDPGAHHEVQSFNSIEEAVVAYFMNLNTFERYQELRNIRQQLRERNAPVDSLSLVEGLKAYSERGADYIDDLLDIIDQNALLQRDFIGTELLAPVTSAY